MKFVDYSPGVGIDGVVWLSQLPRKLPPATNLIRTFDTMSWTMIGVSMLGVSIFLTIVSYLGSHYGIGSRDYVGVMSVPFRILNGEAFPNWFNQKPGPLAKRKFFEPGFTGSYVILLWSMMSMVIALAFHSNIRVMLLRPVYEKTIDSTEDLVLSGKIPINSYKLHENASNKIQFWENYLQSSSNVWENRVFKIGQLHEEHSTRNVLLKTKVYTDGTHVILTTFEFIAYLMMSDPWYNDKTPPYFHVSKELLRPYYHGWIYNKISKWKDDLDMHILVVQQVFTLICCNQAKKLFPQAGIDLNNRRMIFAKLLSREPVLEELEVIKLEFLIFPFSLLGLGIVISNIAFVCEILHHWAKKKNTG